MSYSSFLLIRREDGEEQFGVPNEFVLPPAVWREEWIEIPGNGRDVVGHLLATRDIRSLTLLAVCDDPAA